MTTTNTLLVTCASLLVVTTVLAAAPRGDQWTKEDVAQLSSMSLRELGPAPADPTNRVADDPRAAALGRKWFFDPRLSGNGQVSCATCHIPDREFQDGVPLAKGVGVTNRRTMPIAGMAHSPFLFWDGRKDSLWGQALGPSRAPLSTAAPASSTHGSSRRTTAPTTRRSSALRLRCLHLHLRTEGTRGPQRTRAAAIERTRAAADRGVSAMAERRCTRMTDIITIPGATELVGRGVYRGFPNDIPEPVRDRNAIVAGEAAACARAARPLGKAGWRVTVVTHERCRCGLARGCRRRVSTEVVCATGTDYLEAVVLRRVDTGRIDACNASALFIL